MNANGMESMVRIIPCLDVRGGRVVKGQRFRKLRDLGDPVARAQDYVDQGADEICLLDVSATIESRIANLATIRAVRRVLDIPLTVGGGVKSRSIAEALLLAGADKVAINSAAVDNPDLVSAIANQFGRQCCVLAVDAQKRGEGWDVQVRSGQVDSKLDVLSWVQTAVGLGAGEVLLTSVDRDGTREGYDLDLISAVRAAVDVPVVASGGAKTPQHCAEAIRAGADAVLAASLFHDGDYRVAELKDYLATQGLGLRR